MLTKIDFGAVDAESDMKLRDYFFDNGTLTKIRLTKKFLVLGRKGSGKTALFKAANDFYTEKCLPLLFKDYHWEYHKLIKENGLPAESAYVKSWAFTVLVHIIGYWKDHNPSKELKAESTSIFRDLFGENDIGLMSRLIDVFLRMRRADIAIEGLASGGIEIDSKAGPLLASQISSVVQRLEKFVISNYRTCPVTVLLDQLDDGWDNTDESKNLIIGCLKAVKDLNVQLQGIVGYPPIIVFLRDDIYNELRFNDKNKIYQGAEFLEWDEDGLLRVIARRIAVSTDATNDDIDEILGRVFTREQMRSRVSYKTYITQRTMMRPRDIVAFVDQCKKIAMDDGKSLIGRAHIYKAEERFSSHIYDELIDETHKQYPQFETYLNLLRHIGKTKIRHSDFVSSLPGMSNIEGGARLNSEEAESLLYRFGVIGIPQSGGQNRTGGAAYSFKEKSYSPDFKRGVMVVHPSLKKCLKLTERRAQSQENAIL